MKLHAINLPYLNSADLFERVADQPWAIFLDSGMLDSRLEMGNHADFDVMAIKPSTTLVFDGENCQCQQGDTNEVLSGDPIALLQAAIPQIDGDVSDQTSLVSPC